jgi:DNA-binding transcriptional regulator LsrR (DeoR family)
MKQMTSEVKQQQLEWRRAQVLELASEGYTQREIASRLQVDLAAVNRDIQFLRQQAKENFQTHIHEVVPEEYQKCMVGMKRNLKQTLEIAETAADPKTKLQARAIANDCYKYIMDLTTNGVVITDALKYVQGKLDHLNNKEKALLQDIKEDSERHNQEDIEEHETTNGTF